MIKERNSQLDIAKGLGMTIVVLFHAQILSGVWTQFHMPLFAFLSGLLYREKYNTELNQVWNHTKKKIKGCYVPFLTYNFVFLLLHNLLYKIHIYGELSNQKYYNGKDFVHQIIAIATMGGGESLPGPMWYLIAMLEFTILYACIRFGISKYVIDENKANIYVMIVCVCLMLLGFSTIDLPRMLNRALVLLFWYHLGYMTHTYLEPQKGNIENKKETVITAALSIGILIIGIRGGRLATIFVDYPSSRMCRNYSNVGYGTAC
ncbi:acyltransferase family protein [Faecalicoccus pleomorphus]|nr:acyltransferase family protein [Faecalicoccus pleomorphus]